MNIAAARRMDRSIAPRCGVARGSQLEQSTKYRTLNKLRNHDDNQSSVSTPPPGGFDPTPTLWVF
jgi:hypothetical protein